MSLTDARKSGIGCLILLGIIWLVSYGNEHWAPRPAKPSAATEPVYLTLTADEKANGLWPGDVAIFGERGHSFVVAQSENALKWVARTGRYEYNGQLVAFAVEGGEVVLVLSSGPNYSLVRIMDSVATARAIPENVYHGWLFEGARLYLGDDEGRPLATSRQAWVSNRDLHLVHRVPRP